VRCTTTSVSKRTASSSAGRCRRSREASLEYLRAIVGEDPRTASAGIGQILDHVEDHPLDYYDFEGVIPGAQYGSGDVIVWDWGTWAPADTGDPVAAIESGDLHFDLAGVKLRGRFVLVRRGKRGGGKEQWLLLHKHDGDAVPGWNTEDHPRSVKTGRTNDEVKAAAAPSASP